MKRHQFLRAGLLGSTALLCNTVKGYSLNITDPEKLPAEVVQGFVGAGHGNLEKVQTLLAEYPNLLYCRHDWGNGDFESALEAAAHVGNKEIAQFLLDQGARPSLYALTMLGQTSLVRPILEAYPPLIRSLGAHGFTLLHHAKVGGEEAQELFDYFSAQGLTEMKVALK